MEILHNLGTANFSTLSLYDKVTFVYDLLLCNFKHRYAVR